MLNFETTTESIPGGVVFSLRGDLDVQTVREARTGLDEIEQAEPELLVLDLSGLSFCDSTGMGLIASAHMRAAEARRRCVIVRPRQPIYQAFELTGFEAFVETVQSVEEAMREPGA